MKTIYTKIFGLVVVLCIIFGWLLPLLFDAKSDVTIGIGIFILFLLGLFAIWLVERILTQFGGGKK